MRQSNVNKAELIEVIKTESVCGKGTEESPVRVVIEYWSLEGELLARVDTIHEIPKSPFLACA